MRAEHLIRRYTAYFRGWAQAFGEHRKVGDPSGGSRWLVGEGQVGLILEPAYKRLLYPLFLHRPDRSAPEVILRTDALDVGETRVPLAVRPPAPIPEIMSLLGGDQDLHLYQTYHLIYPAGTRILTLSTRAPLGILYRELTPLRLRMEGALGGQPLPVDDLQ
jgi:hypothetical protein